MRRLSKSLKDIVQSDENALLEKDTLDSTAAGLVESLNVVLESKQHGIREKRARRLAPDRLAARL